MDKKQLRKNLELRLENTLSDLAQAADKKFKKLVKKASKLLADGLHHNKPEPVSVNKKANAPKKVTKKTAAKKAAGKQ